MHCLSIRISRNQPKTRDAKRAVEMDRKQEEEKDIKFEAVFLSLQHSHFICPGRCKLLVNNLVFLARVAEIVLPPFLNLNCSQV